MSNDERLDRLGIAKKQRDTRHAEGGVHGEYDDLNAFRDHALSPEWDISQDRIHVAGIPYKLASTKDLRWEEILMRKKPAVIIYKQAGSAWAAEGKKVGLGPWIVIMWRKTNGNVLKPVSVTTTRPHVYTSHVRTSIGEAVESDQKDNVIGTSAAVKITSLPNSSEMKALVDSGATMCCLHADNWKINGGSVQFNCKQLSPSVITLPLVTQMSVRSGDGGTEYRPVVELNIRVNGKIVQGVQFNLNNRQHMDHPILLGMNFLKQAKLLIDPGMETESIEEDVSLVEEDVDWDSLMEELEPILAESVDDRPVETTPANIVTMMMETDMSLADLVKQIRRLEYAQDD